MRLFTLIMAAAVPLHAQDDPVRTDRYPQIRVLVREAETAAANIGFLDDRSNPHSWAASLYARAGYLDDATRAFGKPSSGQPASEPPYDLWRARVLYGDLIGAEKSLESIADPEHRAAALASLADLLWRMGEPAKARIRFEAARQIAPKIASLEHRKRMLTSIEQGLTYLSEEPPNRLSSTPSPQKRFEVQESPIPLFPITTDGFRDLDLNEIAKRASANGEFMKKLYGRMEVGDREGLLRIAESATTPFQSALGMASIEHILIQARQPEAAEQYAQKIPAVDSDCLLAKAEALSAAGAAWLQAGDTGRAHTNFQAATELVKSVADVPLGKVLVTLSIGSAQAKGGLVASAGTSFRLAKELAQDMPVRPMIAKLPAKTAPAATHYRDEAYSKMLLAAIQAHDLGVANETARLWRLVDNKAGPAIVEAWLSAGRTDDAIASAREIEDVPQRVKALLVLARGLLDRAGAPTF
jgi:tetratricopeptide (TPR) repeat protein